jgi:hypothetical protein
VLLLENLPEWPDAAGVEAVALRFGARLDLAFGGSGERHLDRTGRWEVQTAVVARSRRGVWGWL